MGIGDDIVNALGKGIGSIVGTVINTLIKAVETASTEISELLISVIGSFVKMLFNKVIAPMLRFSGFIVVVVSLITMATFSSLLGTWQDSDYEVLMESNVEYRNSPAYIEYRKNKNRYSIGVSGSVIAVVVGAGMYVLGVYLGVPKEKRTFGNFITALITHRYDNFD